MIIEAHKYVKPKYSTRVYFAHVHLLFYLDYSLEGDIIVISLFLLELMNTSIATFLITNSTFLATFYMEYFRVKTGFSMTL